MYIQHISSFSDNATMDVQTLAKVERFLGELKEINALGYNKFHTAANFTSTSLAIETAKQHIEEIGKKGSDYSCVIYCHYWNDENWNELHTFRLHHELSLTDDARCIEVKAGNQTSLFHAIYLANMFLAADETRDVLIVCADKIDTRFVQRKLANGIFGDAAGAISLGCKQGIYAFNSPVYNFTSSEFFLLNKYNLENEARIEHEVDRVAAKLHEELGKHVELKNITRVVTHNYSLNEIARGMETVGIDEEKIYVGTLGTHAHVPTAGYLLNLDHITKEANLAVGDQILLWGGGVGVGATGVVIEKR